MNNDDNYKYLYLKYKSKYLKLKQQLGGGYKLVLKQNNDIINDDIKVQSQLIKSNPDLRGLKELFDEINKANKSSKIELKKEEKDSIKQSKVAVINYTQ
jgi:hypothetical protein